MVYPQQKKSAIFSHTGHGFYGSKLKLELARFWFRQLTSVVNRIAYRSILVGTSSLFDSANTNTMLADACTSEECEAPLAANSAAVRNFIGYIFHGTLIYG